MIANNYLEIYTLMFGWNMYGAIWDILAGSGIALIPIIAAVVSNFLQNYESGDAKSAIRGIEMTILSMVIVMMLIPAKIQTRLKFVMRLMTIVTIRLMKAWCYHNGMKTKTAMVLVILGW